MPEAEAAFPFRCAQFSTENAAEKCSFYIFAFFTVCRTLIFVSAKSFLTHTYRCAGICKTFVLAGAAGSKASRRVLLKRKQAKLRVDCNGKKGGKSPSPNPNIYVCV